MVARADASLTMGTGHVMRCLALAQAWQALGGSVRFVMAESMPGIDQRLFEEGVEVTKIGFGAAIDANELITVAGEFGASWLVVDGYQFGPAYQRTIKNHGINLLLIDDAGQCSPYCADIILNQNVYADETNYKKRSESTALLLGPSYALLRRDFLPWINWCRELPPVAKEVLVTMGGSDPDDMTSQILRALQRLEIPVNLTLLLGHGNPRESSVRRVAKQFPGHVSVLNQVRYMPELLSRMDLAISAAGTTCYELAFMRVPMILFVIAQNQAPALVAFANSRGAIGADWQANSNNLQFLQLLRDAIEDRELRASLVNNARGLIDGLGASRVCQSLLQMQSKKVELGLSQIGA